MNSSRIIFAQYNEETIRVYQAYNNNIANEAVGLGTFGPSFKRERMTWIKPSFLWMMYRSGWATKEGQERILAIDITREGFDSIVANAVASSFEESGDISYDLWMQRLALSEVRCQWDPDRDIYGNPQAHRAIQLGIKGAMVERYISDWIVQITDITQYVVDIRDAIATGTFDKGMLPVERVYLQQD